MTVCASESWFGLLMFVCGGIGGSLDSGNKYVILNVLLQVIIFIKEKHHILFTYPLQVLLSTLVKLIDVRLSGSSLVLSGIAISAC